MPRSPSRKAAPSQPGYGRHDVLLPRILTFLALLGEACTHTPPPEPLVAVASAPQLPPDPPKSRIPNPDTCEPLIVQLPETPTVSAVDVPIPPIFGGDTLAPLYESLAKLMRGRATDHVRIGMYGDSNLVQDYLTGYLRRQLQARFGDAGHGYVAPGRPWTWDGHMDVVHGVDSRAWTLYAISTHRVRGDAYGVSGIAAEAREPVGKAWVETAPETSPIGRTASRFGVFYLKRPGAGRLEVRLDGNVVSTLDGEGEQLGVEVASYLLELFREGCLLPRN